MNFHRLEIDVSLEEAEVECLTILLEAVSASDSMNTDAILARIRALQRFSSRERIRHVARTSGKAVGFVDHFDDEIKWLMVAPDFQRHGVGTKLLRTALKFTGHKTFVLTVARNAPAISFYSKNGFRIVEADVAGNMFGQKLINVRMMC